MLGVSDRLMMREKLHDRQFNISMNIYAGISSVMWGRISPAAIQMMMLMRLSTAFKNSVHFATVQTCRLSMRAAILPFFHPGEVKSSHSAGHTIRAHAQVDIRKQTLGVSGWHTEAKALHTCLAHAWSSEATGAIMWRLYIAGFRETGGRSGTPIHSLAHDLCILFRLFRVCRPVTFHVFSSKFRGSRQTARLSAATKSRRSMLWKMASRWPGGVLKDSTEHGSCS